MTAAEIEALTRALSQLLADPARATQMGAAGQRRAREHFAYPRFRRDLLGDHRSQFRRWIESGVDQMARRHAANRLGAESDARPKKCSNRNRPNASH